MVFIYWILGIFAAFIVIPIIVVVFGPQPITLYLRDKLFPQAKTAIGKNNPVFLDEEGMIYFFVMEDKKGLGYRADDLTGVTDVYDGGTIESLDKEKIILQNISLNFSDGYTHTISFENKEKALVAKNKIESWSRKLGFKTDSSTPAASLGTSKIESEHSAEINRIWIASALCAFLVLVVGHFYFFYESESSQQERFAQEATKLQQRMERSCTNPSEAISHSRQFIRRATTGSISFIRSSDRGRLIGDCKFRIMGSIEGTNAFGGPVTNYYVITMEGRRDDTQVRWFGGTPTIDHDPSLIHRIYNHDPE